MRRPVGDHVIYCAGGCGKTEPELSDRKGGQRYRTSAFICHECHVRVCGEDAFCPATTCKGRALMEAPEPTETNDEAE